MKTLLIVVMLFVQTALIGQQIDVPEAVLSTFEEMYPEAEKAIWSMQEDSYKVSFIIENPYFAYFDQEGEWEKTVVILSEFDLAENIINYLEENYYEYSISKVQEVELPQEEIYFLVTIQNEEEKLHIKFDSEGEVL